MKGQVGILNVGAGDTKLVFDPENPADMIRAARIVKDMLRRGYALLVDTGVRDDKGRPVYRRAKDFDETKCEYIIADFDPTIAAEEDANDDVSDRANEPPAAATGQAPGAEVAERPRLKRGPKPGSRRVKASEVHVVAVSRSAGG